jgi:hypothetical protein
MEELAPALAGNIMIPPNVVSTYIALSRLHWRKHSGNAKSNLAFIVA